MTEVSEKQFTPAQQLKALQRFAALQRNFAFLLYNPYPKQKIFHDLGKIKRERMLMAANQVGKTKCAGTELSFHVTGEYPVWWKGKRFASPNRWWVGGVTGESCKDNPQRILLGNIGNFGTGSIPKNAIERVSMARGVADAVETVIVKHRMGKSQITFKAYKDGREKWQGETLDGGLWFDEEPPIDIYMEGLTRINATDGIVMCTETPLLGMSDVVMLYYPENEKRGLVMMNIDEAAHFSPERRQEIIDQYLPHEIEARTRGIPMLGSGRIFPVAESLIACAPFPIPDHYERIMGLDFGWDHPTAAVWMARDPDTDVLYVYDCYKETQATPIIHAAAIRAKGDWIPVAWPHDGLAHDKQSGLELAQAYRNQKVKMLSAHAQFPDDRGWGVEAGLMDMLSRMQTQRLKVFSHLEDWFTEFRMYHRKEGRVVKEHDDILCATRYALMQLRSAIPLERYEKSARYKLKQKFFGRSWMSA